MWETVMWTGYSNLLGAGNGDLIPTTSVAYFVCSLVQFVGITLQVAYASVVLFKMLHQRMWILLSKHGLVTYRDSTPVLLFRVADFHHQTAVQLARAEIVVTAFYHKTTTEGETYIQKVELATTSSGVDHGAITVQHALTARSPLNGLNKTSALAGGKYEGLVITVQAKDRGLLYSASAAKLYRSRDLLCGRCSFAPLAAGRKGCCEASFDHHRFDEVTAQLARRTPLSAFHFGSSLQPAGAGAGTGTLGSMLADDDGKTDEELRAATIRKAKLAAQTAPSTYASRGLYLQGPRRYWRRFMQE